MSAYFLRGTAQAGGKDVFQNGAVSTHGGRLRDSPAESSGADDCDRPDLGH
jgi:hypothetical protein